MTLGPVSMTCWHWAHCSLSAVRLQRSAPLVLPVWSLCVSYSGGTVRSCRFKFQTAGIKAAGLPWKPWHTTGSRSFWWTRRTWPDGKLVPTSSCSNHSSEGHLRRTRRLSNPFGSADGLALVWIDISAGGFFGFYTNVWTIFTQNRWTTSNHESIYILFIRNLYCFKLYFKDVQRAARG